MSLATIAFANALVVLGLIILWRTGLVPFGQALFYAIGAYAVALIGRYTPVHDVFFVIAFVGAAAAGLAAYVVGFLLARYREIFFAMLSLAMSMILYGVLVKTETLGSTDGFHVEAGSFLGFRPQGRWSDLSIYWLVLGFAALFAWAVSVYFGSVAGSLGQRSVTPTKIRVEYLEFLAGRSPDPSQACHFRRCWRAPVARSRRSPSSTSIQRWRIGRRRAASSSSPSSLVPARSRPPSSARWRSNWCAPSRSIWCRASGR